MRQRLAVILVCALAILGCVAGPALAAGHNDRAKTATTSSTLTVHQRHGAGRNARSAALTAAATQALNECYNNGQLTSNFSRAELQKALSIMSSSTQEYSDCTTAIHNALAHGVHIRGDSASGSGGSSDTTTIVIIVVVVLVVLAAIVGGLAIRRRNNGGGGGGGDDAPASSGS